MSLPTDGPAAGPAGPDRQLARICRAAILFAVIGVFGTWRSATPVSLNGLEGPHDGWLVIIFALIALAGVRSLSRAGWLGIVTVLVGASAMLYAAVGDLVDDGALYGGRSGWGVWLSIVASVVLAGCAVWAALRRLRSPLAGATGVGTVEGGS